MRRAWVVVASGVFWVQAFSSVASAQRCPYGVNPVTNECRTGPPDKRPQPRSLKLVTNPLGARVISNYTLLGTTPLILNQDQIAPGEHTFRFELDGYEPQNLTVIVKMNGPTTPREVILEQQAQLNVIPKCELPGNAKVKVIGSTESGMPLLNHRVRPSMYKVVVTAPNYEQYEEDVVLRGGEEKIVRVCLRPKDVAITLTCPGMRDVPVVIRDSKGQRRNAVAPSGPIELPPGPTEIIVPGMQPQVVDVRIGESSPMLLDYCVMRFECPTGDVPIDWLRDACKAGDAENCTNLAFAYHRGCAPTPQKDDVLAKALYQRACERGSIRGCVGQRFLERSAEGSSAAANVAQLCKDAVEAHRAEPQATGAVLAAKPSKGSVEQLSDLEFQAFTVEPCRFVYMTDENLDPTSYVAFIEPRTTQPSVFAKQSECHEPKFAVTGLFGAGWSEEKPFIGSIGVGMCADFSNVFGLQVTILGLDVQSTRVRDAATDERERLYVAGLNFSVGYTARAADWLRFRLSYYQTTGFNKSLSSPGVLLAAGTPISSQHWLEVGGLYARMPSAIYEARDRDGSTLQFLYSKWQPLVVVTYSVFLDL